jgi:hypothetical protein
MEETGRIQDYRDEGKHTGPDDDCSPGYRHDRSQGHVFRDQGNSSSNTRDGRDEEHTTSGFLARHIADLPTLLKDEQCCLFETLRHQNTQRAERLLEDLRRF